MTSATPNYANPIISVEKEWHLMVPDGTVVLKKSGSKAKREKVMNLVWPKLQESGELFEQLTKNPSKVSIEAYQGLLSRDIPKTGLGSEFEFSAVRVFAGEDSEIENRDCLTRTKLEDLKFTVETLGRTVIPGKSGTLEAVTSPIASAEQLIGVFEKFKQFMESGDFTSGVSLDQAVANSSDWTLVGLNRKGNPTIRYSDEASLKQLMPNTQVTRAVPLTACAKFLIETSQCKSESKLLNSAVKATNDFFSKNPNLTEELGMEIVPEGISDNPSWQLMFLTFWMTMNHILITLCKDLEANEGFSQEQGNLGNSPYGEVTRYGGKFFFPRLLRSPPGDLLRTGALPPAMVRSLASHFRKKDNWESLDRLQSFLIDELKASVEESFYLGLDKRDKVLECLQNGWLSGDENASAEDLIHYTLQQELRPGFTETSDRYKDTKRNYGININFDEPSLCYSGTPFTAQYEELGDGTREICIPIEIRAMDDDPDERFVSVLSRIDLLFYAFLRGELKWVAEEAADLFSSYHAEVLRLRDNAGILEKVGPSEPSTPPTENESESSEDDNIHQLTSDLSNITIRKKRPRRLTMAPAKASTPVKIPCGTPKKSRTSTATPVSDVDLNDY